MIRPHEITSGVLFLIATQFKRRLARVDVRLKLIYYQKLPGKDQEVVAIITTSLIFKEAIG
jgi:hypothetical protein